MSHVMPVEDDPSAGCSARRDWERAAKVRSVCIVDSRVSYVVN